MTIVGPRRPLLSIALVLAWATLTTAGDLDATEWSAKVDPPSKPMAKRTVKDFAIPFPAGFGQGGEVNFPSTPSTFVVIGKNFFDNDSRQVWDLSTKKMVGSFKGKLNFDDKTVALSADGQYLAGKPNGRQVVEVRATKNGRVAQTFDLDSPFVDFLDFVGLDRVIFGHMNDGKLSIGDIKSGDVVARIKLERGVEPNRVAFSPGGAYMAAASNQGGGIKVYDLAKGDEVGQAPTPKKDGANIHCEGLVYSPDGLELAGIFEFFGSFHVAAWDAADGKELANFEVGKEAQKPAFYKGRGIDYLPDKSGWLLMGTAIVDREAGKKVWTLPFDDKDLKPSPRRFLDEDHAVVVSHGKGMSLRSALVPRDKIAGASKIVRAGGSASDATLPPIKPTDLGSARHVSLEGKPGAWDAVPDAPPAPKRLTSRRLPLKGKPEEMRSILFAGAESSLAVVVGTPVQFGQPAAADGQPRWVERFDLAGGKSLGKVDLPNVSDPVAISPDGNALILREAKDRDRLDVFTVDGKPVVGWRPYEKESAEDKVVTWSAFLDPKRVLTINAAGTLVLWSIPDAKAVYVVEGAFQGPPAISPGRKLLAGFDGKGPRVLDAETGALLGEGLAPAGLGPKVEPKSTAFRADGQQFAVAFNAGTVLAWDVKTGKVVSDIRQATPWPTTSVEWAGDHHVVLNRDTILDLGTKRVVWGFVATPTAAIGPDGRQWFVARGQDSGALGSVDAIDPGLEKAEAMLADAKAPAVLRPGSRVSISLNIPGPAQGADAYKKALADAIAARLKAAGMVVVDDGAPANKPGALRVSYVKAAAPDARLVLNSTEKDTGRTVQYSGMGAGRRAPVQSVRMVDLVCEMTLVDAAGTVSLGSQTFPMEPFGFVLRMPAGENDPEVYLKKLQWERIKSFPLNPGPPYFVARDGATVLRLPGWNDLNLSK